MNALRILVLGLLAFRLYPATEEMNRKVADGISVLPDAIAKPIFDVLSISVWIYILVAVVMFGPMIYKIINRKRMSGRILPKIKNSQDINELTWEQFEELTAEIYEYLGYKTEVIGGSGGDGGIDVLARKGRKKTIVQCKHWKDSVGVTIVREMFGVLHDMKVSEVHIITTSNFTPKAIEFAEKHKNIRLIAMEDIMGIIRAGDSYLQKL